MSNYQYNKKEKKLIEILAKFENNLTQLQQNINIDIMDNRLTGLPNLNLNFNNNEYDNYENNDAKTRTRRQKSTKLYKNSKSNSSTRSRTKSDPRSKFIQTFNDSDDLQQSTIASSISTNADLSEDEQTNYYDESLNWQNDNIMTLTNLCKVQLKYYYAHQIGMHLKLF